MGQLSIYKPCYKVISLFLAVIIFLKTLPFGNTFIYSHVYIAILFIIVSKLIYYLGPQSELVYGGPPLLNNEFQKNNSSCYIILHDHKSIKFTFLLHTLHLWWKGEWKGVYKGITKKTKIKYLAKNRFGRIWTW